MDTVTSIRYRLHFAILTGAALIFWLAKDIELPASIYDFGIVHYGLMGIFHATAIIVSLRDRKAIHPLAAFCFVALAALWSGLTPLMGLLGSVVWLPTLTFLPPDMDNLIFPLITGSAIGSAGYWFASALVLDEIASARRPYQNRGALRGGDVVSQRDSGGSTRQCDFP